MMPQFMLDPRHTGISTLKRFILSATDDANATAIESFYESNIMPMKVPLFSDVVIMDVPVVST